jgi:hypothetical protein
MAKRNNDQVCLKLPHTLRAALEDEAATESRGLSSLVRKILIEYAATRRVERATRPEQHHMGNSA